MRENVNVDDGERWDITVREREEQGWWAAPKEFGERLRGAGRNDERTDDGGASETSGSARLANTGARRASSARGWEYFYLAEDSILRGVDARQGRDESTLRRMTRRRARLRARLAGGAECSSFIYLSARPPFWRFFFSREIFHVPLFFFSRNGAPRLGSRERGASAARRAGALETRLRTRGVPPRLARPSSLRCAPEPATRARASPGAESRFPEPSRARRVVVCRTPRVVVASVRGFGPAGPAGGRGRGRTARGNPSRPPLPHRARPRSPPPRPAPRSPRRARDPVVTRN